jgi:hypothetical protein
LIVIEGVEGTVSIGAQEMQWRFVPNVEDVAGNRLHRAFDVDTSKAAAKQADAAKSWVNFRVE